MANIIHIRFHDNIRIVANYEYSPYLNGLANSSNIADKEVINGITYYNLNELDNINVTDKQLNAYIKYLSDGKIKYKSCNLRLFDYMGHNVKDLMSLDDNRGYYEFYYYIFLSGYLESYIMAKLEDTWIRDNMYKLQLYKNNPLYGLHEGSDIMTKGLVNAVGPLNKLFRGIDYYIAGGYPLYLYYNNVNGKYKDIMKFSDADLFFCNENCEEAVQRLYNLVGKDKKLTIYHVSPNSISFKYNEIKCQIILRRYKAPTEIVHGFDVDCCGILIHNDKFYMTSRAKVSIDYNVNMFDYTRMSESYPYRMKKYISRGFNVLFPQLELVNDIIYKYEALLIKYVSINNANLENVNMSEIYRKQDYWKKKLEKYGMKLTLDNMLKIGMLRTKNYTINVPGLNSSALSIFLTDKYNVKISRTSDYLGKGIIKPQSIVWKEQDPMTQVTSTFNPEIYTSFEDFITQHNLDIMIHDENKLIQGVIETSKYISNSVESINLTTSQHNNL